MYLITAKSQDTSSQITRQVTDIASANWKRNVRKIVSKSRVELAITPSETKKKQEIEEMLLYTIKCVCNYTENTLVIIAKYTETLLKEIAATKLTLNNCEQRMAHIRMEQAGKEEKIVLLQ